MRDSGLSVIVGNRRDEYWDRAVKDGFDVYPIERAAELGDVLPLLVPDEVQRPVYEGQVKDGLEEEGAVFAHSYNIHYGFYHRPSTSTCCWSPQG